MQMIFEERVLLAATLLAAGLLGGCSANRKGLVSETGEKKLAFEVLSRHYAEQAAPR